MSVAKEWHVTTPHYHRVEINGLVLCRTSSCNNWTRGIEVHHARLINVRFILLFLVKYADKRNEAKLLYVTVYTTSNYSRSVRFCRQAQVMHCVTMQLGRLLQLWMCFLQDIRQWVTFPSRSSLSFIWPNLRIYKSVGVPMLCTTSCATSCLILPRSFLLLLSPAWVSVLSVPWTRPWCVQLPCTVTATTALQRFEMCRHIVHWSTRLCTVCQLWPLQIVVNSSLPDIIVFECQRTSRPMIIKCVVQLMHMVVLCTLHDCSVSGTLNCMTTEIFTKSQFTCLLSV